MFAEVAVEGGVPWLAEALERHLSFWSGAAPPAAVCRWGPTLQLREISALSPKLVTV